MTRAEAIAYLRTIMESASLPNYQAALRRALEDMEMLDSACSMTDQKLLQALSHSNTEPLVSCNMRHPENGNCAPMGGFCSRGTEMCRTMKSAYNMGWFDAIREQLQSECRPLTWDELLQMDEEPVYLSGGGSERWGIVHVYHDYDNSVGVEIYFTEYGRIDCWNYGHSGWLAYRRKPEGVNE